MKTLNFSDRVNRFSLRSRVLLSVAALFAPTLANAQEIHPLNPALGQFPEDVALSADKSTLFGSFFPANQVGAYDSKTFAPQYSANVPAPTGMTLDANGNLLVATAPWFRSVFLTGNADPTTAASQGVWRVTPTGVATQLATLPFENNLPNGIATDAKGNIYVSNLIGDQIFRIDPQGHSTVWAQSSLLAGDAGASSITPGFPAGGNGLQVVGSTIYVSNTDKGTVYKIGINSDGSAGNIGVQVSSPTLKGLDGFKIDSMGNLYGGSTVTDKIWKITPDGTIVTLADYSNGLRASSGIALDSLDNPTKLYFSNFSIPFSFLSSGSVGQPGLGVLALVPEPGLSSLLVSLGLTCAGFLGLRRRKTA